MDKCESFSCQVFLDFNMPKLLKSVNFWQLFKKLQGGRFGTQRSEFLILLVKSDKLRRFGDTV